MAHGGSSCGRKESNSATYEPGHATARWRGPARSGTAGCVQGQLPCAYPQVGVRTGS
ncbi:hypothetical protein SBD_5026 [Streptomyces bottropensis ATCC 25435]|uniref:Uncharacterized protein n=1 Tax=Streptomyces bottropensis ATCC 25435 TaxID=1054862 RepID=M3EWH1_9ACTN|nr:hypothetical protein SBD_5026 [Streptomyces bottropensis ATCC 25435]